MAWCCLWLFNVFGDLWFGLTCGEVVCLVAACWFGFSMIDVGCWSWLG